MKRKTLTGAVPGRSLKPAPRSNSLGKEVVPASGWGSRDDDIILREGANEFYSSQIDKGWKTNVQQLEPEDGSACQAVSSPEKVKPPSVERQNDSQRTVL